MEKKKEDTNEKKERWRGSEWEEESRKEEGEERGRKGEMLKGIRICFVTIDTWRAKENSWEVATHSD